jgi:hypothetical protein
MSLNDICDVLSVSLQIKKEIAELCSHFLQKSWKNNVMNVLQRLTLNFVSQGKLLYVLKIIGLDF